MKTFFSSLFALAAFGFITATLISTILLLGFTHPLSFLACGVYCVMLARAATI